MHFVWHHRLGLRGDLHTVDGRRVRVLDQGTLNNDAGPDFFNASIEIDGQCWAGNVEMHVRASDWYNHRHHLDHAYDSVVLHVVLHDDREVCRPDGSVIPQMVIRCSAEAADWCNRLTEQASWDLPCRDTISGIPPVYITDWITALAFERFLCKSERLRDDVAESNGNWSAAAYRMLARGLGFGLNAQPFEQLARSLPLEVLRRHSDDHTLCEAMVIGQAGLIPDPLIDEDPYVTLLRRNYTFMANKFGLKCTNPAWKMGRTRPQNLPYRRLAYLAQFVCYSSEFIDLLESARTLDDMRDVFDHPLLGFWASHFTFSPGAGRERSARAVSRSSIDRLLINVALPLLHARAMWRGDIDGASAVIERLENLPPEDNAITRLFATASLKNTSAFTSQALIQLRREYCEKKKCLYCRFGHRMLSAEIQK